METYKVALIIQEHVEREEVWHVEAESPEEAEQMAVDRVGDKIWEREHMGWEEAEVVDTEVI